MSDSKINQSITKDEKMINSSKTNDRDKFMKVCDFVLNVFL